MKAHEVTMHLERLTKGAALYKVPQDTEGSPVTNLYLRKSGLPLDIPEVIIVTIDFESARGGE